MANVYDPELEGSKSSGSSDEISRLRTQEAAGGNSSTGGNSWSTTSSTTSAGGGSTTSTGSSDGGSTSSTNSEGGGSTTGTKDENLYNPKGENPSDIKRREESSAAKSENQEDEDTDDKLGKGYTSSTSRRRVRITRRQAIAGGVTGSIIVVVFGGFSVVQGPLEIVHFAQLLDEFHFSSQQDAEDGRLTKIARYLKDPTKPENTRMGLVGNAIANNLEAKIYDATGLKPDYDSRTGEFKGYTLDKEHPNYKGMENAQIKEELTKLGIDPETITVSGDGKSITIDPEKNIKSLREPVKVYRAQTAFARNILAKAGLSKKSAYVGSRVLTERAGWTFHPIKKIDAKIQAEAIKAGKSGIDKIKQQFAKDEVQLEAKGSVTATPVETNDQTARDNAGNPTDQNRTAQSQQFGSNIQDDFSKPAQEAAAETNAGNDGTSKLKDKITPKSGAAGVVGLAGLLCIAQSLNEHVQQAKFDKAMLPMMRKASKVISTGSQVQSGDDIAMLQAGLLKDFLTETDKNGKVVSTWNQATSIRAENGQTFQNDDKYDIPKSGQVFSGNILDGINGIPALGTVCGIMSSPLGIAIGIVSGPISFAVSTVATGQITSLAAGWLSGSPVNPLAKGSDFGNFANYGARLSANDQFAAAGGAQLDQSQEVAIKSVSNSLDKTDFQSKGLAYRLFNPTDSQSLVSRFMDQNSTSSNLSQNVASAMGNLGGIFASLFRIPGTLLTSTTHAASNQTYDYHGLKKVGFTAEQLSDSNYDNPFKNACMVTGCHEAGKKQYTGIFENADQASKYTELAKKCFGVEISNDGTADSPEWNINRTNGASVDMYGKDYPSDACKSNDQDWMRIRFWLLDTATIEGYDCYAGDTDTSDQSCQNSGIASSSSSITTSKTSDGGAITGEARDLARQILDSHNISLGANPRSSLEAAAKGEKSPSGIDECGVQHPPVALDSKLLAFLVDLGNSDQYTINSLSTGMHVCDSNHYKGLAVDLACDLDTTKADSIGKKYGISHNYESCPGDQHWHYSIGGR